MTENQVRMTSPDDGSGASAASGGVRPRHFPPRWDKRGASAERSQWGTADDDSSPTLSDSRVSLNSNRDSGYVPSPAGAVRFDLDSGEVEDSVPSAPAPQRQVTRPISIPCRPAGLPPPEESALLRRRLRRRHRSPPPPTSSDEDEEEDGRPGDDGEDNPEDRHEIRYVAQCWQPGPEYREQGLGGDDGGAGGAAVDEVDQAEAAGQVALLYREARSLQVGWREGAVVPPGFTFRADLPDLVFPGPAAEAQAAAVRRRRPTSRASSASLTVELDVGQELREIADSLPLSRSAPGALLPRRNIWTLIRQTFDFGARRELPPRPGRHSDRQ